MIKYIVLILYMLLTIGIGIHSRKKVSSTDDFFLGGRNVGGWMSAFAYATTIFSAVIFINAGVLGWNYGISMFWIGLAGAVSCAIPWFVYAKRTKEVTEKLQASTMPEFFDRMYNSKGLKIISSLIIFIFMVPYTASVYQGIGFMFEKTFGLSFEICIFLMAVLTGIYLVLGGYVATAMNSVIQGIIIFIGTIGIIYYITSDPAMGGGIAGGLERLGKIPEVGSTLVSSFGKYPLSLLAFCIIIGIGPLGLPQMVHKFYTVKGDEIKKAGLITTIFALIVSVSINTLGGFSRLFYNYYNLGQPEELGHVMPTILEITLHPVIFSVIVILLLAAAMSTLSSLSLVASSSIAIDLLKTYKPNIKDETVLNVMRYLCIAFIAISVILALTPNSIVSLMSYSWGAIAGSFLAPYTYGLFWNKANKYGAWASIITAILITLVGIVTVDRSFASMVGALSILVPLVIFPVVTLLTQNKESKAAI